MRFRNPLVSTTVQPSALSFSSVISVVIRGFFQGAFEGTFKAAGLVGFPRHFINRWCCLVKRNGRLAKALAFDDDAENEKCPGGWPMRGFCASLSMVLLASGLGGSFDAARAQTYPNRTITLVVPL